MRIFISSCLFSVLLIAVSSGQTPQPLGPDTVLQKIINQATGPNSGKLFPTQEDYCFEHPNGPTCRDGHPVKLQVLPLSTFKPVDIFGTSKTYRGLADYCHDHPKSPRCANQQPQIVIPGTGLNLPASWRFAHPHPDALAGINIAALRQSAITQKLLSTIATAMHVDLNQYGGALTQLGQLDQVWLSLSGNEPLFLLQGQMRIPEGFFSFGNGMTAWRISKSAVVIGKEAAVRDAVERLSSLTTASAMGGLAHGSTQQNDFWMTGTPKLLASQAAVVPMSKEMTSYSATISVRSGLQASFKMNFANAASAQRMMTETKSLLTSSAGPVHISIEGVGNSVRLGLSIPERDLTDTLEAALSGPAGKQLAAIGATIKNAQGNMMITGSQTASGNSSGTTTANGASLISNIQGGELEPAPAAHAATEPATGRKSH